MRNPFGDFARRFATKRLVGQPTWNPKGGWLYFRHPSGHPFVSYRGKSFEGYAGWRPSGIPGIALRHNSTNSPKF